MKKTIEAISTEDLRRHPVWVFSDLDDDMLQPHTSLPIKGMAGKLFATKVTFSNQKQYWAMISNIDENEPKLIEHFLTISLLIDGKWFHLARYHDSDFARSGPAGLAHFLGINVAEIFPISYDLSSVFTQPPVCAKGLILPEPKKKLSEEKLIQLALS